MSGFGTVSNIWFRLIALLIRSTGDSVYFIAYNCKPLDEFCYSGLILGMCPFYESCDPSRTSDTVYFELSDSLLEKLLFSLRLGLQSSMEL